MRYLIVIIFCLIAPQVFAQICPTPEQKVVIFFGNGIDTDIQGARTSRNLLQRSLGDIYNDQALRYDLAYNNTSGVAMDLVQSAAQAAIQWDSQVFGWLNNIGMAPDWYNNYRQKLLLSLTTLAATDLADQVESYRTAILFGQKVVVVAHSQGNFYVNEAKKLLAADMTPEQMKSFAIYSVANPANNVGGGSGPYVTNNRDIIQTVPSSLPANWTLRTAAGLPVDLPWTIKAHLFNDAYISSDYDVKPTLLAGIKAQMDNLKSPIPNCDNYRKYFISMLAGSYAGRCDFPKESMGSISITSGAQVIAPNLTLDLSSSFDYVRFNRSVGATTDFLTFNASVDSLNGEPFSTEFGWDNNKFIAGMADNFKYNGDGTKTGVISVCADFGPGYPPQPPPTYKAPVDLVKATTDLLKNYRTSFPKGACGEYSPGVEINNKVQLPVSFTGTTIFIGDNAYDLSLGRAAELIALPIATFDPTIQLDVILNNGTSSFKLEYRKFFGLKSFEAGNSQTKYLCTR